MTLFRIHMELARSKGHPEGDAGHFYEFIAPLSADGALDAEAWRRHKEVCTVTRSAPGEEEMHGHLRHVGRGWRFFYEGTEAPGDEEEEPIFRLDRHRLAIGEYVSVTEHDEVTRTFVVTAITPSPLG